MVDTRKRKRKDPSSDGKSSKKRARTPTPASPTAADAAEEIPFNDRKRPVEDLKAEQESRTQSDEDLTEEANCHWAQAFADVGGECKCIFDGDEEKNNFCSDPYCATRVHEDCFDKFQGQICNWHWHFYSLTGEEYKEYDGKIYCPRHCRNYRNFRECLDQTRSLRLRDVASFEENDECNAKNEYDSDSEEEEDDDDENKKKPAANAAPNRRSDGNYFGDDDGGFGKKYDSSEEDESEDDDSDDELNNNNYGRGVAKAKSARKKKKEKPKGTKPEMEIVAKAFENRTFKLPGGKKPLQATLKKQILADVVFYIHDRASENYEQHDSIVLDGLVNPSWWDSAFQNIVYPLLCMLKIDKDTRQKTNEYKGKLANFVLLAMELGRLFHTQNCGLSECELCNDELPDKCKDDQDTRPNRAIRQLIECYEVAFGNAKELKLKEEKKEEKKINDARKKLLGKTSAKVKFSMDSVAKDLTCPCCNHKYLLKCKGEVELEEANEKKRAEFKDRNEHYEDLPKALQKQNKPRLRLDVMEYQCPCYSLSGYKCPLCEGKDKNCEICACVCRAGPMTESQFESFARAAQLPIEDAANRPRTIVDNQRGLLELLTTAVGNGMTDIYRNNVEDTLDNIGGASASYVSQAEVDDNLRHGMSEIVGQPTTRLGDTDITTFQKLPKDKRFYRNRLGELGTTSTGRNTGRRRKEGTRTSMEDRRIATSSSSNATPPPTASRPPEQRQQRTFEERSDHFTHRVYRRIDEDGIKLQKCGSPATRKHRRNHVLDSLASSSPNRIRMSVKSKAVESTPVIGLSQSVAAEALTYSSAEEEEAERKYKEKKKRKKKKRKKSKKH